MADYRNDKFQIGDIVRLISDHNIFGRIDKVVRKSDIDTHGRWDEEYFWTEYHLENGLVFTDHDDDKYELLLKEVGFNQIHEWDKVLIANGRGIEGQIYWHCDFAAGWTNEPDFYKKKLMTISQPDVKDFPMCRIMPYNDYTKQFIGSNLHRPNFYYDSKNLPNILQNIKDYPESWKAINDDIRYKIKYNEKY